MILKGDATERPDEWSRKRWDAAFVGVPVDERGRLATEYVAARSGRVVTVGAYSPHDLVVDIDSTLVYADAITSVINLARGEVIALEATTLGFVELFLLLKALKSVEVQDADITYVEPWQYAPTSVTRPSQLALAVRREFELSSDVTGYLGIPGATIMLTPRTTHRSVFFLGFEERRLDVAFEDFAGLRADLCDIVFGVPAYSAGWEMNAFANNVRVLNERRISGDIYYCAASEPHAAQAILKSVEKSLGHGETLLIAPIGTKPHGIAVAEFAASRSAVGVLYDHPNRKPDRSVGVRLWHRYGVAI